MLCFILFYFFAEPVEPKTTTARPLPHWFPPASPRPSDWSNVNKNNAAGTNASTVSTAKNVSTSEEVTTLDPEDYENEAAITDIDQSIIPGLDGDLGDKGIQVKVPKVPYNFEAFQKQQQQSKSHLPINLPSDISEDPEEVTANKTTKKPSVRKLQVLANFTQYCPPTRARGLFWNWTSTVNQ